jgi:hypothetical protein
MQWQSIESKMFTAGAYDADSRVLYLRFRSGDVYRYFDFPQEAYREFLSAEPCGRFFLSNIRDHFRYERLAKLRVA